MTSSRLTVITGASRGLGRAMAEQLLQPGQRLLCISRQGDEQLAASAREAGVELEQWQLDLSDPVPAAARLSAWLQGLDAAAFDSATLINNAGTIGRPRPLSEAVASELAQALRVGLEAPMLLASAFLGATKAWRAERKPALATRALAELASWQQRLDRSSGRNHGLMASGGPT